MDPMGESEQAEWAGPEMALDELARSNAILEAISYAATRIVGLDWHAGIQDLLDRLGEATGVSRVTLLDVHPGPDGRLSESVRCDWAEPGLARLSADLRYQNMPLLDDNGELDEWTCWRQQGRVVTATLSEVTGYNRQVFLEHGTLSLVSVPVFVRSGYWGVLCFDDCKVERTWGGREIEVLKTAAALIAGALDRFEAEERLRLSEERYALAARGANDGLWDWDIHGNHAYFSPRLHEILGLAEDALRQSMANLFEQLDGDDARAFHDHLAARFRFHRQKFRFEARQRASSTPSRWLVARGLIVYDGDKPVRIVGSLRDITDHKLAVARLTEAERQRANLARYFSPNMVDELMQATEQLHAMRLQNVAVLFADLFNFTALSAGMPGAQVIDLLREFHSLAEEAVFSNDGTLDKYMGDGLMATFGTPRPGPLDATHAVTCARKLVIALNGWNDRREAAGHERLQIGVGLHHGAVTLGNVGSTRRLELTVVGNTVNVASRIEAMSRELQTAIVASDAMVAATRQEGGDPVLRGFTDLGIHAIRGHKEPVKLWGLTAMSLTTGA